MRTKREKKNPRLRSKLRIKRRLQGTDERPRISVFKSAKFTYAQIISDTAQRTLVSAATNQEEVQKEIAKIGADAKAKSPKSVIAAKALGLVLAQRAKAKNITQVLFDRNGFTFGGRIKAIADGAREGGLEF